MTIEELQKQILELQEQNKTLEDKANEFETSLSEVREQKEEAEKALKESREINYSLSKKVSEVVVPPKTEETPVPKEDPIIKFKDLIK